MATNNNAHGTPIAPLAGGMAIANGSGDQHAAFAAALVGSDATTHEGYTLAQAVVRIAAAGAPLWSRKVGKGDLSWCVRKPSTTRSKARGTMHVFAHRAAAGAVESCAGNHGDGAACKATTRSKGDAVTRWRTDGDANGAADTRIATLALAALAQAFATAHAAQVAMLRARGATAADLLATPSIAQRVECVRATMGDKPADAMLASMGDSKPKPATRSKAGKATASK